MIFTYRDGMFIATSSYEEVGLLSAKRGGAGWRFHWATGKCKGKCPGCDAGLPEKTWWTDDPVRARRLLEFADDSAREALEEATKDVELSKAADCDIDVPCPEGLAYLPFQRAGIAYGLNHESVLIADDMGCVDGEAMVAVNRGGKGFKVKLKDAHDRFHGGVRYTWDPEIDTYMRALCDGELRQHRVLDILDKGKRDTLKVTLKSGKVIHVTPDHEILCADGTWRAAENLRRGQKVLTNGTPKCARCGSTKEVATYRYATFRGYCRRCIYRHLRRKPTWKGGRFVDQDGYVRVSGHQDHPRANRTGQVYEHILVMEKHLGRRIRHPEMVHHKNGDRTDNRLANLENISPSEHHKRHGKHKNMDGGRDGRVRFSPIVDRVSSVCKSGKRRVYDVVMDDPHHNFVANGIVVHNCGKTVQAIGVANADESVKNVLVICPASLRINWLRESERWNCRDYFYHIVDSAKAEPPIEANWVIVNYDLVHKPAIFEPLMAREWDLLIVDEAHFIKNVRGAKRAQAILGVQANKKKKIEAKEGIIDRCRRKAFLTGTPIPNGKPLEIHPLLAALDPQSFGNWWWFTGQYCGRKYKTIFRGKKVLDVSGATNLSELQERMRQTVMVRRTKDQVLTELPPKRRALVELPRDGMSRLVDAEQKVLGPQFDELKAEVETARDSGDKTAYDRALAKLAAQAEYAFTEMSEARADLAEAKAPKVAEHVDGMLEERDAGGMPTVPKVIVFCWHHVMIDYLRDHWGNEAVRIDGRMNGEDRQRSVDRFQQDPGVRVCIGQIQAAGVGLTLTAAQHVVFGELAWVPGDLTQAEDRAHRIGQKGHVLVQHLVIDGSIDAMMAPLLVEKQNRSDQALDREDTELKVKAEEVAREKAKGDVKRKKAKAAVANVTAEQRTAAHEAMQLLAGRCDGARTEDGAGFNKLDTHLGKRLAASPELTDAQVLAAIRLARKYRRQLSPTMIEVLGVQA
jgi:SWI/SNF-related matrix-associated actin-dependent regulator 1 of chromatin subfamily A